MRKIALSATGARNLANLLAAAHACHGTLRAEDFLDRARKIAGATTDPRDGGALALLLAMLREPSPDSRTLKDRSMQVLAEIERHLFQEQKS